MTLPIDLGGRRIYTAPPPGCRPPLRNLLFFKSLQMQAASPSAPSRLITPPFVVAVVMLAVAAILAGPVATWKKLKRTKLELPLKQRLSTLDVEALSPYHVPLDPQWRIDLEPTIVETLGTDEYIYWKVEDTSVPADDPLRFATLMVTYYSGGPNLVPHIPDVCLLASGYQPARPLENEEIEVASLHPMSTAVPVRVGTFVKTAVFDRRQHSVVYTFFCNGRFVCTRTAVRLLINDPTKTYAFFSKVEVSFERATRAQSMEGARKLFEQVLPILIRDHWPDFEAAEREADDVTASVDQVPQIRVTSDVDGNASPERIRKTPHGQKKT